VLYGIVELIDTSTAVFPTHHQSEVMRVYVGRIAHQNAPPLTTIGMLDNDGRGTIPPERSSAAGSVIVPLGRSRGKPRGVAECDVIVMRWSA
jgi:hypothetical protein